LTIDEQATHGGKIMRTVSKAAAAILLGILIFSCGTRDERNDIRAQYGEPDAIRRTTVDPFWSETWIYNERGVAFEFQRTAGCGSTRDVYLYATYPIRGNKAENTQRMQENLDSLKVSARPPMPMAPR
jgi:hypothetical protein